MGLYEIKNFCTTKEMISKLKRLSTEWEKIVASYTFNKGSITRLSKELKKVISQRINNPLNKWANELNR
jgi:hypothetical protein